MRFSPFLVLLMGIVIGTALGLDVARYVHAIDTEVRQCVTLPD